MTIIGETEVSFSEPIVDASAYGREIDLFGPPAKCQHRTFGLDNFSAVINDERGEIARREVRVRFRCMECGVPCRVDIEKVRRPSGGEEHGIVVVIEPAESG